MILAIMLVFIHQRFSQTHLFLQAFLEIFFFLLLGLMVAISILQYVQSKSSCIRAFFMSKYLSLIVSLQEPMN